MRAVAVDAVHYSPRVQRVTARIAAAAPSQRQKLNAVWNYLRRTFQYEADPKGIELIRYPEDLLELVSFSDDRPGIDCDEMAIMAATLLLALGFDAVFIAVGRKQKLEHVFGGVRVNGKTIPLDVQEGLPPGKWPSKMQRVETVEVL